MRLRSILLTFLPLSVTQGCYALLGSLEAVGPSCTQEQIVVTWPATITRGASTTTPLLTTTLTQTNVDRAEFDALHQALTEGSSSTNYAVTWTIPAFDVNGGYIALSHLAPLATGETQQITSAFNGGGWGARAVTGAVAPSISVRADNFQATSATGSITALASSPLRLRIDITAANAAGETIRLTGDAGFFYDKVKALCN